MSNIIKFTPKKKNTTPTLEEVEQQQIERENEFIDDVIEHFIVHSIGEFATVDKENLLEENINTTKMLALLRETLIATICLFKDREHPLHKFADEAVEIVETLPDNVKI